MKYPNLKDSAIYTAIVLVTAGIVFFGLSAVGKYNDLKSEVKTLNATVEAKDGQIADLNSSLSQTEAGKKAAEDAKAKADANAAGQTKRANSAEADAANKGSQLADANVRLDNVNRCIAKFDSVLPSVRRYQQSQVDENRYANLMNDAASAGNWVLSNYYWGLAADQTNTANSLWPNINSTFTAIANGNCW